MAGGKGGLGGQGGEGSGAEAGTERIEVGVLRTLRSALTWRGGSR